jgi:hypothetical protein
LIGNDTTMPANCGRPGVPVHRSVFAGSGQGNEDYRQDMLFFSASVPALVYDQQFLRRMLAADGDDQGAAGF